MNVLQIASFLIVLAAIFGAVNYLFLRLPRAIGILVVALALSLPPGERKPLILRATYVIVVFSIIVQGLTVARLARRLGREPELGD